MANLQTYTSLIVTFLLSLIGFAEGYYCTTSSYGFSGYTYQYCTYGCCGSWPNEYCCTYSVGLIVGCVIAGIVALCVIIALVCCCIKQQGQAGRVVQPQGVTPNRGHVTVVHAGGYAHPPAPQVNNYYPMGPTPPQYKPHDTPPAYNYTDPAYPPGAGPHAPNAPNAPANPPNPFAAYANNQPPASTTGGPGPAGNTAGN